MRFFWGLLLAPLLCAETATVSVLATTDLHGYIYPFDYYTNRAAPRGLASIATLVRQARSENPNSILIDCGDTIQGAPLEYVYQALVRRGRSPLGLSAAPLTADPMMLAMNRLRYDAMVVGNHEFNFGLKNLRKARSDAHFPWLAANIEGGAPEAGFSPYLIKTVAGVKIAVIGITTPAVPTWEKPENLGSYRFTDAREAVRRTIAELRRRERPDLILVAAHSGLGTERDAQENVVGEIARGVEGIDAIVFGHTHQQLAARRIGPVLVIQPKNWGMSLARVDFSLERQPGGGWKLLEKKGVLIPVTPQTAADPEILALARPYHELAERYLDSPVTESSLDLSTQFGRVEDNPLIDAVHAVQLHYSGADVSFTSVFNLGVRVPKGPVTVRQIAALYLYDNQLYLIEGTGQMVKDALENAARYFLSCRDENCSQERLINPQVQGFNFDSVEGVSYQIDLTRPEGDRIRNLEWKGRPLAPDQTLRIAVNNYRPGGSAGYSMFAGAKVLWKSADDIRDLMIQYYSRRRSLPAKASGNWRIVPPQAVEELERQVSGISRGGGLF